jgi:hypothetical protein
VKLSTINQATAYKGIQNSKERPPHPTMERNLETTREVILQYTNEEETDGTIWTSLRSKIF